MYPITVLLVMSLWAQHGLGRGPLCPEKCDCDVESKIFDCTNSGLGGIPIFLHPEMIVLKARNNKITKLEDNVNIYNKLETLDLSSNQLHHLGKYRFAQCEKLQHLNLSNNFVASIHRNTFDGPKVMQILDLSYNTLTELTDETFKPLTTLMELRLSHNKINRIEPNTFDGLARLRVLYLDHNLMNGVDPNWFEPLENLRFLYLGDNLLRMLPSFTFRPLKALQILDLSSNKIHNISEDTFYSLRSLDTLDVSGNLLNTVPFTALSSMENLANLKLSQNPIKQLDKSSLSGLYVLKKLYLDNMYHLETVDLLSFVDTMHLSVLSLSNNGKLHPLPYGVFNANTALKSINFGNNTLWTSLSPHQLPIRSLDTLDVSGIPFYCNCSLTWLWELYQVNHTKIHLTPANCASISNSISTDVPLKDVNVDDLACADWTFVLIVASVSVFVTVGILIVLSVIAYKCRQRSQNYYASPCLHIKDDTMIYTRANYHQNPLQQTDTDSSTYAKAVLQGGYSPPCTTEPFYEVPKFYAQPSCTAGGQNGEKSNSTSSSSKYSSSGYVGSELWENDFLGLNSQIHYNTTRTSPRSSSGLGSNSGSSTSSSHGTCKPVFFSPVRNFNERHTNFHHTLSAHNSPVKYSVNQKYSQQQHPLVAIPVTSNSPVATATNLRVKQQRNNIYVL